MLLLMKLSILVRGHHIACCDVFIDQKVMVFINDFEVLIFQVLLSHIISLIWLHYCVTIREYKLLYFLIIKDASLELMIVSWLILGFKS